MMIKLCKLPRNNTTYAYRRHSSRFKWFMIYMYLTIRFSITENNTTNLGVCLTVRCTVRAGLGIGS
jgi:hypothetical protein